MLFFFFFYGTRAYQAWVPYMELEFGKLEFLILFFPYNQQININIKISDFFFHLNAQTYVFIYLNRIIVKYRNFNFKILIFKLLIPLVHSFLTHSSISSFSEALWSNWFKYWGLQWEIRTTCKRKIPLHVSSSSMWHFFNKKNPCQQKFFFFFF